MALSKERKGEIGLAVLLYMLTEQGCTIDSNFRRRVGNIAKKTGLPFREVLEFSIELTRDILDGVSNAKEPPTPSELSGNSDYGRSSGRRCGGGH